MSRAGELMAAEIAEQPAVLARLISEPWEDIAVARRAIESFGPRFVLLAARGTSDHAALYAKYLVEIRLGLPAGLVSPSALTIYRARQNLTGVLFIAVSQSGRSPDLVESLRSAREQGALTIAVTNDQTSPLALAAALHVDIRAGAEHSVAATKTYTAQLLALYLLLTGESAERLPDAAAQTLAHEAVVVATAQRLRDLERIVTTARGYSYPTAREAALKLMETSYLPAQAFSGADLLHGPLAMLSAGRPVLAVHTPGMGADALVPVLARLVELGVDLVEVGPRRGLRVETDGLAEALAPIVQILPLQQFALHLALARGGDPDRPRGLSKVTSTW